MPTLDPGAPQHREFPPLGGTGLITLERDRQVERWTPEHDDSHTDGQLAEAARAYVERAIAQSWYATWGGRAPSSGLPAAWPFEARAWRPADDPVRNLVKAGALIAAEIDRLRRV